MLPRNITSHGNVLHFHRLDHPKVVDDFIIAINQYVPGVPFTVEIDENVRYFPNVCVPITGILALLGTEGYIPRICKQHYLVENHKIFNRLTVKSDTISDSNVLDKVWCFRDSDDVNTLVTHVITAISQSCQFAPGALNSL